MYADKNDAASEGITLAWLSRRNTNTLQKDRHFTQLRIGSFIRNKSSTAPTNPRWLAHTHANTMLATSAIITRL